MIHVDQAIRCEFCGSERYLLDCLDEVIESGDLVFVRRVICEVCVKKLTPEFSDVK